MDLKKFHVDEDKVWFTGGYWPKGVPHQFYDIEDIKEDMKIPGFAGMLHQATKRDYWDNNICLFALGTYIERVTFRTLVEKAKRLGTFLYDLGIRKGDVVAIELPNSINYVVASMGCQYIGATAAGVNPQYKSGEILYELIITEAKVLVIMDALWRMGPSSILETKDNQTKVKYVISTNLLDFITAEGAVFEKLRETIPDFQESVPDEVESAKIFRMKNIISETEPKEIKVDIDPWEDVTALCMTGGTTGLPKAAMLTYANIGSNLAQMKPWVNLDPGVVTIGIMPFFHSQGATCILAGALSAGLVMVLFPKPPSVGDMCEVINQIEAPQGAIYSGVEILYKQILDYIEEIGVEEFKKKYDIWKKLRYCTSGAGPLHDYVRIPFGEIFPCGIRDAYGLTEASPVVSINPFWGKHKPDKIGLPLPGVDWAIFDPDDFEAGPICDGTPEKGNFGVDYTGELCVAGPMVMKGYLGRTEDNIRILEGKKWLLTGDIGFMDEHGFVAIRDRKKSLIKSAGHSIFPKEVEELMGKHEMISQIAVGGIPDKQRGEKIKAWVKLKKGFRSGRDIDPESLKNWCYDNMAKWKTPHYIEFVRRMPIANTGKVQTRFLIEKDIKKMKKGKEIKG
ncbi:MAG: AMP-binding protein [Candidatus Hodarchaeales archaeon]|jgi:long-chain acyl-CoA synthetase